MGYFFMVWGLVTALALILLDNSEVRMIGLEILTAVFLVGSFIIFEIQDIKKINKIN